jgi:hypothetical protein
MKRRTALAVGLVAAAAAAVAVAVVLFGGGRSRLSEPYLRAARGPCAAYKRAVQPLRVGGSFDDYVRITTGLRAARIKLAGDLRALPIASGDRRKLQPLLDNLASSNAALAAAPRLEAEGKDRQALRSQAEYIRALVAQGRLAKSLGLRDCG